MGGEGFGPLAFFGFEGGGFDLAGGKGELLFSCGRLLRAFGVLEVRTEVTDLPARFFGSPLVVEIDEALEEDLLVLLVLLAGFARQFVDGSVAI